MCTMHLPTDQHEPPATVAVSEAAIVVTMCSNVFKDFYYPSVPAQVLWLVFIGFSTLFVLY